MRNQIECIDCKSAKCFVKRYCTGKFLDKISTGKIHSLYKKGEYIFREGNLMSGIHFIQTGGVKIVTSNLYGREQIVRFATDGNILGHKALGRDKYYFNAAAMMDTLVCFVESDVFHDACMNNPAFTYNLLLFYALELRKTELRVKYQAQMNIREKVAEAFVYMNEVFGTDPKTKTLNIELNRQDIADTAGTTAEQVTRQLRNFEDENLISRHKRSIQILNMQELGNMVSNYKIE